MRVYRRAIFLVSGVSLVLVLGLFAPVIVLVFSAFADTAAGTFWDTLLANGRAWPLLRNTFSVAALTALCSMAIALPLGFCLTNLRMPGKHTWRYLFVIPLVLPPYIVTLSWIRLLGPWGIAPFALESTGGMDGPAAAFWPGLAGSALVMTLCYFPLALLTTALGFASVDVSAEEAGRLFLGRPRTLQRISLPQVLPGCMAGGLLVFIMALGNFSVPSLLRFPVYPLEIFTAFNAFYDFKLATISALPLLMLSIAALLLYRLMYHKRVLHAYFTRSRSPQAHIGHGLLPWAGILFSGLVFCAAVVFPIGALIREAGHFQAFVLAWNTAGNETVYSLLLAVLAGLVLMALGLITGYSIVRGPRIPGIIIEWVSLALFAIPGTILGIGLILCWNQSGIMGRVYDSKGILILAAATQFLAVTQQITAASLRRIPGSQEEAAALSGLSWAKCFRSITVRLVGVPLMVSVMIGLVLSFGELNASILVCPAGATTLPIRLFGLLHYGVNQLVAALSISMVAGVLLVLSLGIFLIKKGKPYAWHSVRES